MKEIKQYINKRKGHSNPRTICCVKFPCLTSSPYIQYDCGVASSFSLHLAQSVRCFNATTSPSTSICIEKNKSQFPYLLTYFNTSSQYNEGTYRYTGHERDYDISKDYMISRHYSYIFERFITPDPVNGSTESPLSWNLYNYVNNNPIMLTDPKGTMAKLQGLGKAADPYPVNYSFPLAVGYISPAELSAYYSIILSIALEVEYGNYKIQYAEAVNQFITILQEQIKNKGDIYNILYNIFKMADFGQTVKEVATQILKWENRYISYGTKVCDGTECSFSVIHKLAIALAHTHPLKDKYGHPISEQPSISKYKNGKLVGDIPTSKQTSLPNIVISRYAIWVAMPDGSIHNILRGIWWENK